MKVMRIVGIIVFVIGILVLILSLLADLIGVGGAVGYGTRQIVGTIIGAIMAVAGLFLLLRKK